MRYSVTITAHRWIGHRHSALYWGSGIWILQWLLILSLGLVVGAGWVAYQLTALTLRGLFQLVTLIINRRTTTRS